jgi:hypothetical protein
MSTPALAYASVRPILFSFLFHFFWVLITLFYLRMIDSHES